MKKKISLISLNVILLLASTVFGATYYVDPNGLDTSGNGSKEKPWRSISHGLKIVRSGDTISLNNGTYNEGPLIVPAGVSITSTSRDKNMVTVRPNTAIGQYKPFVLMSSDKPGSQGNQTISHISWIGVNGTNRYASMAVKVKNRNNVRIHHCNFDSFREPIDIRTAAKPIRSLVHIISTSASRNWKWWNYWPADTGLRGDDSAIEAAFPPNPVTGFEFDHNVITASYAITPYHVKDSSIHDNVIDNRATYKWTLFGTMAILNNVDVYNNRLLGAQPDASNIAAFTIELWVMWGGCEFYNNTSNLGYSITYGKETKFYDNAMCETPLAYQGEAILGEFTSQSYLEVCGNFFQTNGNQKGIVVGLANYSQQDGTLIRDIIVRNNVIYNTTTSAIRVVNFGAMHKAGDTTLVQNVKVYNNVVNGPKNSYGIYVGAKNNLSSTSIENVNVHNNVVFNVPGEAGLTGPDVTNITVSHNLFYNNKKNHWRGSTATNTFVADPLFKGSLTEYEGYNILSDSPARDKGVDVGLAFSGSAPDIGALEIGGINEASNQITIPQKLRIVAD